MQAVQSALYLPTKNPRSESEKESVNEIPFLVQALGMDLPPDLLAGISRLPGRTGFLYPGFYRPG